MDWHRMVSVPIVQYSFDGVSRNGCCNIEWCLRVVGLSRRMFVHMAVIHNSSGRPIMFGRDDHSAEPLYWLVHRNSFQDTQAYVPL